ncbi:MAG: FMN-dependent NADH-azoreductase [Ramlibacter sp.]|jgi:FMN-dependent NADH-azoreductase|nr:FMN-dependent NADH-azoreductase [Ramlibacter sp.]
MNLLVLNASPRRDRSLSRRLGAAFLAEWLDRRPHDGVVQRDVGIDHPPLLTEGWIAACFTPDEQQTPAQREILSYSDAAIEELTRADVLVIATPRYNYGMPAALKAWFDQVIRIRRTFHFDPAEKTWPLSPMLSGKKLVLLSSSGEFAFQPGGLREQWDHLEPHVRTCAHYLGVASRDLHHVAIEFQEFGDERHAASVQEALQSVKGLAGTLAARDLPLGSPVR